MKSMQNLHILLVEDDEALLGFYSRALCRAGHIVETCTRGDDGLRLALAGNYDVLVLDWHLPGLNGCDLLRQVRAAHYPVSVLMLTGSDDSHRSIAYAAGTDGFLEKPCGLADLVRAVETCVRPTVARAA